MSDTHNPSEADLERGNARVRRADAIDDLERNHGLRRGLAAEVVDFQAANPTVHCSKCGADVPRDDLHDHVLAHAAG